MAETKRKNVVDGIDYPQLFQFPILFRAVPLALAPSRLIIALFMLAALVAAGGVWDGLTQDSAGLVDATQPTPVAVTGVFEGTVYRVQWDIERLVRGVLTLNGLDVGRAVADLVFWLPISLWTNYPMFTIVFGLLALLLAAICGGAISRMTAAEVAGIERLRIIDGMRFSMTSWLRLALAPLVPLVFVAILALVVTLTGVLTNVLVLDVLASLFYGLMLLLGFVMALLLIAYVAAGPMIIPAVACENCDALEAMHRPYGYVFSRPLHLLGYWIVLAVALTLGFLLVSVLAWATLNITGALFAAWTPRSDAADTAGGYALFHLFSRTEPAALQGATEQMTAWLIRFWEAVVLGFVAAYFVSFKYTAATLLYLLMRRATDGQSIEEVWRPGLMPGTLARTPQAGSDEDPS